ncbi:carbohydrate ABC transporter ATP-binding prot ein, CUT1 family (plasmid) [Peptoclostridium acidaminophilum DSM 3953]|uniref:Carbohydrate ABC transporter ATP-binding prot ein, CUT1 family n=1 Tax=Peptoclostridium acidaminophilum DSM 3953 TaxID=1286171 RepID=W8UAR8_PEPAC|nr:DUF3343 domain-containing protein [Peptoclostridium acidaminophilum]AHM57896.1 carbohydrate ABC transporter ATP-binding prot ein, CUT1 family [Peptoclostridium acidaminophilum DSM 3953]
MFNFFKKKTKSEPEMVKQDRGILVFANTSEVIKAENALKNAGWEIRVMGPPPEIRSGCDLVIEFPLIEEMSIVRRLSEINLKPTQIVPVTSVLLEPVSLCQEKEFGKYIMVRAANMKITVDRETLLIVNISGGGCPDVPYLAEQMVSKHLSDAPQPRDIGYTLCAYALQIAYERVKEICLA